MHKLLHSNFIRLRNTLSFGLSLAFFLLWNGIMLFSSYDVMVKLKADILLDSLVFTFFIYHRHCYVCSHQFIYRDRLQ